MISTNAKSFFVVVAALTLSANISCTPVPSSFRILQWDKYLPTNSSGRKFTAANYYPTDENEFDTERIVGGKYAAPSQFPFMAVVHRLIGNGVISQCGGTIISRRWVLTAGHCVAPEPHRFLVVFGVHDKTGIGYDFYRGRGVAMLTNQGIVHPEYRTSVNDIALLRMPQNIPFGANIQPIRLGSYNDITETFADRMSMVIGWGKDGPSGTGTKRLKYAIVPIISNYRCSMFWSVTKTHVCTAAGYGQDACQGDSGGPLVVLENGVPLQVGIVSYGDGNCPSGRPGVFTRVSGFIDWIQQVVNQQF